MNITIHWWQVVVGLVLLPFIYIHFRKSDGDYDSSLDSIVLLIFCWVFAIGLTIGKLL